MGQGLDLVRLSMTSALKSPSLVTMLHVFRAAVPQCVGGDGHNAFWALFRSKARGVLQRLIGQGGQMEAGLVWIAEPGAAGHGQHLKAKKIHSCSEHTTTYRGKGEMISCILTFFHNKFYLKKTLIKCFTVIENSVYGPINKTLFVSHTASCPCILTLKSLTGRDPRYRVLVSDRSPVTGSKTVRSSTPFW